MRDPVSALRHQSYSGFAEIKEIGPLGMITLRCDLSNKIVAKALKENGFSQPDPRRIAHDGSRSAGWMSPDELLLILPYAEVAATIESLTKVLAKNHFLLADVSDARAVFRVAGADAAQVLAKLCPVDLHTLAPNELRRTRAAQVAAAFWRDDAGFTVVSFRSVAVYVMDLLRHSAMPGSGLS